MTATLNERAKMARLRVGFDNPGDAAKAIGCSRTAVVRWEDDPAAVSIGGKFLTPAARAYRVRTSWLSMESDDDGFPHDPDAPSVSAPATAGDYVHVVDKGLEGDMGDGRINDDFPEVIRAVDYTQQFIRGLVGFVPPPGRLALVTGRGDSMIPTIQPGESLLVDTGVTSYDRDGIYLVNLGNGQQIKRLIDHGKEDGIHVHSDNPAYPAIRWPKGGVIGGKVYLRNRTDRID